MKNAPISYVLARLPIGMSMLGHGIVHLPKLHEFSDWMVGSFGDSFLPASLVMPFSYALPVVELNIGFLLLVGLFTRQAIVLGSMLMVILIFGSCMLEDWQNVFVQMMYGFYFAVLLFLERKHNRYSFDHWLLNKY